MLRRSSPAMYGVLGHWLLRVFTDLMAWPLAAVVQTCICGVDGKTEAARGNIHQNSLRVMMQPMFFINGVKVLQTLVFWAHNCCIR